MHGEAPCEVHPEQVRCNRANRGHCYRRQTRVGPFSLAVSPDFMRFCTSCLPDRSLLSLVRAINNVPSEPYREKPAMNKVIPEQMQSRSKSKYRRQDDSFRPKKEPLAATGASLDPIQPDD